MAFGFLVVIALAVAAFYAHRTRGKIWRYGKPNIYWDPPPTGPMAPEGQDVEEWVRYITAAQYKDLNSPSSHKHCWVILTMSTKPVPQYHTKPVPHQTSTTVPHQTSTTVPHQTSFSIMFPFYLPVPVGHLHFQHLIPIIFDFGVE